VAQGRWLSYQVVSQQLHDQGRVLVALLAQRIKLSNSVVKSLLGKMARLVRRVEDFVVEHREVESETKADGVSRCEICLGDFGGVFVGF